APLQPGDWIVLIGAGSSLVGSPANDALTAAQGVTLTHDFLLNVSGNQLVATLVGTETSTGSVALSEGFLAGLAFVNIGAELVAGQGTRDAARAARESLSPSMGLATFMTLSGGSSRYRTGSHVDARGLSLLAGLAWGRDIEPGRLTLGAFFEYGQGNFDTYNSFPNAPSLRGDGDARHIGGGILASADIAQVGPGTLRAETFVRAGRIHVSFRSPDLMDPWGLAAEYDASSAYYGASLGLGYEWNLADKTSLDFYGQYFWTRQGGDNVVLSTGDPVTFEDADSSRLHLGTRLSRAFSERVSARVGAAYERELAGAARASVHGHSFQAPSLKGGTGVGELGLAIAPAAGLPLLTLDLSLQGYAGEREGWSGNRAVKLEF
ncbi:MAG: autotransporter outer membrane beta-barrel domain-containing protein, partial [Deltaproteobacteria bacterium]|nr:autotransporter outer membrane beta-barrel domain-containing protein [Deltaproteobacteria bacterium]